MRIELQEPFASDYTCGYLGMKQGRMHITLYRWMGKGNKQKMERMLYARYLLGVHLGRRLTDTETVDHIDGDKANDSIENLQVLSMLDNKQKYIDGVIARRQHGTATMYRTGGCRCSECCAAHRQKRREEQRRYKERHPDIVKAAKRRYYERHKQKQSPGSITENASES